MRCGICYPTSDRVGAYCSNKFHGSTRSPWALDHVVPVSQGGAATLDNLVLACVPCNQHKQDRTPEQAGMRLLPVSEAT